MGKAGVYISIVADEKASVEAFRKARGELEKLDSGLGRGSARLKDFGATMTRNVTLPIVAGFALAAREANEALKVTAQTGAVLRSTGGAANVTAAGLDRLVDAQARKTAVDDDVIASGANMLLTFTNVRNEMGRGNKIFDQGVRTAHDMATAMGEDLQPATIRLGKALNDPVAGLTALRKVGVAFTEQQQDQIKTMVASGDVLGAQKMILAELNKEFGGSAEAAATPVDRLKVEAGELAENVGMHVVPALQRGADVLGFFGDQFAGMPDWAQTFVVGGAAALAAVGPLSSLAGNAGLLLDKLKKYPRVEKFVDALGALKGVAIGAGALIAVGVAIDKTIGSAARGEAKIRDFERTWASLGSLKADPLLKAFEAMPLLTGELEITGSRLAVFQNIANKQPGVATRIVDAMDAKGKATGRYKDVLDAAIAKQARNADADEAATKSIERLRDGYNAAAGAAEVFQSKVDELLTPYLDSEQALLRYHDGLAQVTATLLAQGATLDLNTEAGRQNRAAITGSTTDVLALADAMITEGRSVADVTTLLNGHVAGLTDVMRQAGLTDAQINDYLTTLGLTPDQVATLVKTLGTDVAKEQLGDVRHRLDDIDRGANGHVDIDHSAAMRKLRQVQQVLAGGGGMFGDLAAKMDAQLRAQGYRKGGEIPGPAGQPRLITAHGGEMMLSADIVDRIRRGTPTRGAAPLADLGAAGAPRYVTYETHRHYHLGNITGSPVMVDEQTLLDTFRRAELLTASD